MIAYNDDSFQDTDSTIIDLTLPTTGTYYAMVTSSPKSASLNEPLTGDYELFMYTFATNGDPPAGDTMYGGSGDDTIIAGSADDTIAAQPQDTIIYGSGTATLLAHAPYLDVTAGPNLTVNEGQYVTLDRLVHRPLRQRHAHLRLARRRVQRPDDRRRDGPVLHVQPGQCRHLHRHLHVSDPNGG